MNTLQLTFDHPVKGNLLLRPLSGQEGQFKPQNFETDAAYVLRIETEELESGSWELVLEWEHENRNFQHRQVFEVKEETNLFKTSLYAEASLFHSRHPLHCMNH